MDTKNTLPAARCGLEPLRNAIAAAPDAKPSVPVEI
jgi:hypothetical protein